MRLTDKESLIVLVAFALGSQLCRFLPFLLLDKKCDQNKTLKYLGTVLPDAAIGLLLVYSLKDISFSLSSSFVPQLLAVSLVALVHYLKENMLLSIAVGTISYMLLIQFVF